MDRQPRPFHFFCDGSFVFHLATRCSAVFLYYRIEYLILHRIKEEVGLIRKVSKKEGAFQGLYDVSRSIYFRL